MSNGLPELTIGELARRAGLATSAIRYYERVGLLPPADRVSGQRRYGEETVGRLAFIAASQNAGFTLREIRELADRSDDARELAAPMRELSARKLPEVRAAIEHAEAMRTWLEVASGCECASTEECALFPQPAEGDAAARLPLSVQPGSGCRRAAT
jgi:MerR family transcriptional regulator, redox-sensitive transcriptional activator SoxR